MGGKVLHLQGGFGSAHEDGQAARAAYSFIATHLENRVLMEWRTVCF
jgi:hypothetical protein